MLEIRNILFEEMETTRNDVISNMSANRKYVSGKTAKTLRTDASENEVILWGASYFKTMEEGIKPGTPFPSALGILSWGQTLGFLSNDSEDWWIAKAIARGIYMNGSLLYRAGGKQNIYTPEIPALVERIKDRIGKVIIDTKIIE